MEANLKLGSCEQETKVDSTMFRQLVGCLRFLCHSRPEISFGVGLVSRYMKSPRQSHLVAAKRILRYLKGTLNHGVLFPTHLPNQKKDGILHLVAYSDSDWCGDQVDRRSTMGYVFFLGEAPFSWSSKKQDVVALSTCEAEYIAACSAACQGLWIQTLIQDLELKTEGAIKIMVDNKSAINLAKNPVSHGRSKHIETKYHFLRDQVSKEKIKLQHCGTDLQVADILTKPLKIERFKSLRDKMNVEMW